MGVWMSTGEHGFSMWLVIVSELHSVATDQG